jgi:hypothetical protein
MKYPRPLKRRSYAALLCIGFLLAWSSCIGQSGAGDSLANAADEYPLEEWEAAGGRWMLPLIDSLRALRLPLYAQRYDYFMAHVYRPAMQKPHLAPGNRLFLNRLKAYLECPSDSCARADKFIRPVFRVEDDSLHASYRIVTDFPPGERGSSYDGSGWGDDTLVTSAMRAMSYKLYFSNVAKSTCCKIQRYGTIYGPCLSYRSYKLRQVPMADTLRPAFCSPYALDLVWGREPAMDSLMTQWTRGCNIFNFICNPAEVEQSFAQMRGVPDLYFCIDLYSGWCQSWESPFPTVGIYMKVDGQWAVPLWSYQYENSSCACI